MFVTGNDLVQVRELAGHVQDIVRQTAGIADVTNSAAVGAPEMILIVDRDRAADLGLTAGQIAQALRTGISGAVVTRPQPPGEQNVDVRVISSDSDRTSVEQLLSISLTTTEAYRFDLDRSRRSRPQIAVGFELRAPMAVVVIGGLLSSTLLTLLMIPSVYTIMDDIQTLFARLFSSGRRVPPSRTVPPRHIEAEPEVIAR